MGIVLRRVAVRAVVLAGFTLGGAGGPVTLAAQPRPLEVRPRIDLDFGVVWPGVAKTVSRLDATAGQFEVRGEGNAEVLFTFTLPSAIVSGGGQTLPVAFGPNDGGFAQTNVQTSAVGFDPRVSYTNRLHPTDRRAFLWLGGTAQPAPTQAAGLYTGTVTLTVAYTGA